MSAEIFTEYREALRGMSKVGPVVIISNPLVSGETYSEAIGSAEYWDDDNIDTIDFGEADCND